MASDIYWHRASASICPGNVMAIETSIILNYGKDAVADSVVVELDSESPNNLTTDSDGTLTVKSSFLPGESPVILLNYDPSVVTVTAVKCTDGNIGRTGSNLLRTVTDIGLVFDDDQTEHQLSYKNTSNLSVVWYGNSARPTLANDVVTTVSGDYPCYGKFTYDVLFQEKWQLNTPADIDVSEEDYTIYVVVYVLGVTP